MESQFTNDHSRNTFDMNKLSFSTDISFEEHFHDYECGIVADIVYFATIYGTNKYLDYCVYLLEYLLDVKIVYFNISC